MKKTWVFVSASLWVERVIPPTLERSKKCCIVVTLGLPSLSLFKKCLRNKRFALDYNKNQEINSLIRILLIRIGEVGGGTLLLCFF